MDSDEECIGSAEGDMEPIEPGLVALNAEILDKILAAKTGEPSKFQSFWGLDGDADDVMEFTEEEIENEPNKRILWAAEKGHLDIVKSLVEQDPTLVQSTDSDNYTPLHRAAYTGNTEIIKFLLQSGADVHARTVDDWQPLHSACHWNHAEEADLLLQNGASVNAQTKGGQTPLHLAVSEDSYQAMMLLLTHPFLQPDLRNSVGETAQELCQRVSPLSWMFAWCPPHASRLK